MSKYVNGYNYKKVSVGSETAIDLSKFTELNAASSRKGVIGITETGGSYRVVLYSDIISILEDGTQFVKISAYEKMIAIQPVSSDTPGAYEIKKGGIIYSSDLSEKIISLTSGVDFKPNSTTRCGRILEVQTDEDGSPTVIISFD